MLTTAAEQAFADADTRFDEEQQGCEIAQSSVSPSGWSSAACSSWGSVEVRHAFHPRFHQTYRLLLAQLEQPTATATTMDDFFARNPIGQPVS